MYVCIHTNRCLKCRDIIVVRVLGWDMKVPGSIPETINYTGYASDTSKSLGECLRLRSNHNLYLNGRLAEKVFAHIYTGVCQTKNETYTNRCLPKKGACAYIYIYISYIYIYISNIFICIYIYI